MCSGGSPAARCGLLHAQHRPRRGFLRLIESYVSGSAAFTSSGRRSVYRTMDRKRNLLARAAKAGWFWTWDYSDHVGRVFTFYALLIGSSSLSVTQVGWMGSVAAVGLFALFALCVGAFNEWDKAEERIEREDRFQDAMAAFEGRCYDHISQVERLLAAQKAAGPPEETDLARALRCIGTTESEHHRREADKHERQTVATFIESEHIDRGVALIDFLIEWQFVGLATREHIAEPKTISQIKDGLDSIRWGAEHLPVYRTP